MSDDDVKLTDLQPIDLLLEEGSEDELRSMRRRVAEDPQAALEFAETVALIERMRGARTEPGPAYATKLNAVIRRAERNQDPVPQRARWLLAAAAALLGFGVASWWDRADGAGEPEIIAALPATAAALTSTPAPLPVVVPTVTELAHRDAVEAMRRRFALESAPQLSEALMSAVAATRDPLDSWLDPTNALAVRRLDHELRRRPEIRRRALQSEGAMLAADQRVQRLAVDIATELTNGGLTPNRPVSEVALVVRALIAAGVRPGVVERAYVAGSSWLGERLPELGDEDRVSALSALVECAAIEGRPMPDVVAAGEGLIDSVMLVDEDTWGRRRPHLLSDRIASRVLGDAGHTLAILPALGVSAGRCDFVRRLMLGELRERRAAQGDGPDLLAAMLYGFGDLLSQRDRDAIVLQLRRWKPVRLAPDFTTVHQIAWGIEPGQSGFTRLQLELRQLVILPDPRRIEWRAGLCLCLASNYAAQRQQSLERFVGGW